MSSQPANDANFPDLLVDAHLLAALNSSPRDRDFIIRVEGRLLALLIKGTEAEVSFTDLNSYYRMLVHRVTRYYDLQRTADPIQRSVTVYRPPSAHPKPLLKLADLVEPESVAPPEDDSRPPPQVKFTIMKREAVLEEQNPTMTRITSTRTLAEREAEYERVRARIFWGSEEGEEGDSVEAKVQAPPSTGISSLMNNEMVSSDEIVQFQGWQDIEAIKPFIPSIISSEEPIRRTTDEEEPFNFASVWVPQHIWVITSLPLDEASLKSLKSKCRRKHCKMYRKEKSTSSLLLFSYRVGETSEELTSALGVPCQKWQPRYYIEPPNTS